MSDSLPSRCNRIIILQYYIPGNIGEDIPLCHDLYIMLGWFPTCITNLGGSYSHMDFIALGSDDLPYTFYSTRRVEFKLNVSLLLNDTHSGHPY